MTDTLYAQRPDVYDALYSIKGYDAEVEFVVERFGEAGNGGDRVLVAGCGTGEHGRRLVERGYDVVGVDKHEAMIERARTKSDAEFRVGELPALPVDGEFDLVWLPFNVVNYLGYDDLADSLAVLGDVLADGGLLVLDQLCAERMVGGPSLHCHETDDGAYARLIEVHEVDGDRYSWDSLVFTPDGEFFVDSHVLTDFDREFLAGVLDALGLSVEAYDWYGVVEDRPEADDSPEDDTVVFVGRS